jgi:branched-subunit amino acid aminotransferase/4-amino-4-deoxychorismate lyase
LDGALRLNWSRGSAPGRGIDLPAEGEPPLPHRFWLQFTPLQPSFRPVTVWISQLERRQATSLLSQCKTFAYGQAIQARREARSAGAEEALLLGTGGELCCGATANLLVCRGGTWLTPPLASGCLPGVMRQRGLDRGLITEAPVNEDDLQNSASAFLLNSLSCRPISHLDARPIANPAPSGCGSQEAETFWRQLLQASP